MKFDSDTPIADPYDAALKMLDIVRVSNKTLLDAGKTIDEYLETPQQPRDAKRTLSRLAEIDEHPIAHILRNEAPKATHGLRD